MMAVLWADVAADIASARRHFAAATSLYQDRIVDPAATSDGYMAAMAFQHAMQSGYTSFESGMKRLLHMLQETPPVGPDSHAALVRRLANPVDGARPAVLGPDMARHVEQLRRFRHVAMHGYDEFRADLARLPVESARAFLSGIDGEISRFRTAIDPD